VFDPVLPAGEPLASDVQGSAGTDNIPSIKRTTSGLKLKAFFDQLRNSALNFFISNLLRKVVLFPVAVPVFFVTAQSDCKICHHEPNRTVLQLGFSLDPGSGSDNEEDEEAVEECGLNQPEVTTSCICNNCR